jgi:hypothetical protein
MLCGFKENTAFSTIHYASGIVRVELKDVLPMEKIHASFFPAWYKLVDVPRDICIMYLVQGSFYLHSLYATLFMDCWRKDSVVMILHHFLTLALIAFSYGIRYVNLLRGQFILRQGGSLNPLQTAMPSYV